MPEHDKDELYLYYFPPNAPSSQDGIDIFNLPRPVIEENSYSNVDDNDLVSVPVCKNHLIAPMLPREGLAWEPHYEVLHAHIERIESCITQVLDEQKASEELALPHCISIKPFDSKLPCITLPQHSPLLATSGVVSQCSTCMAMMNPFNSLSRGGLYFRCSVCHSKTELPPAYFENVNQYVALVDKERSNAALMLRRWDVVETRDLESCLLFGQLLELEAAKQLVTRAGEDPDLPLLAPLVMGSYKMRLNANHFYELPPTESLTTTLFAGSQSKFSATKKPDVAGPAVHAFLIDWSVASTPFVQAALGHLRSQLPDRPTCIMLIGTSPYGFSPRDNSHIVYTLDAESSGPIFAVHECYWLPGKSPISWEEYIDAFLNITAASQETAMQTHQQLSKLICAMKCLVESMGAESRVGRVSVVASQRQWVVPKRVYSTAQLAHQKLTRVFDDAIGDAEPEENWRESDLAFFLEQLQALMVTVGAQVNLCIHTDETLNPPEAGSETLDCGFLELIECANASNGIHICIEPYYHNSFSLFESFAKRTMDFSNCVFRCRGSVIMNHEMQLNSIHGVAQQEFKNTAANLAWASLSNDSGFSVTYELVFNPPGGKGSRPCLQLLLDYVDVDGNRFLQVSHSPRSWTGQARTALDTMRITPYCASIILAALQKEEYKKDWFMTRFDEAVKLLRTHQEYASIAPSQFALTQPVKFLSVMMLSVFNIQEIHLRLATVHLKNRVIFAAEYGNKCQRYLKPMCYPSIYQLGIAVSNQSLPLYLTETKRVPATNLFTSDKLIYILVRYYDNICVYIHEDVHWPMIVKLLSIIQEHRLPVYYQETMLCLLEEKMPDIFSLTPEEMLSRCGDVYSHLGLLEALDDVGYQIGGQTSPKLVIFYKENRTSNIYKRVQPMKLMLEDGTKKASVSAYSQTIKNLFESVATE